MTDIEKTVTDLAVQAAGITVVDQASASRATELVLLGKKAVKTIKDFFEPLKASARASWQGLVDKEKSELSRVEPVVDKLTRGIADWRAAEERKRREAEEAARRAEVERRRLEEEALRKVREAEERAEQERLRLEREAEELQKREREAREADDRDALAKIEERREEIHQEAKAVLAETEAATDAAIEDAAKAEAALPTPQVVPEAPKTEGLAMKYAYSFAVDNKAALPEEFKIADMVALNAMARAKKDDFRISGGHVVKTPIMSGIGKRGIQ